jgi:ATP-binding cassette subfamily C (CFTR/MRP) protein 4
MIVIGSFGIAIFINYWVLIPILPLFIILIYVRNYFLASSRELKRIEGICRSPIFIHANSTLTGITTIRAARKEKIFASEFDAHQDYHTRAYFAYICIQRWFSIRLDLIVVVFIIFSVISSIIAKGTNLSTIFSNYFPIWSYFLIKEHMDLKSGQIGLLLTYLFQLSNLFYWSIKTSCEIENMVLKT